MSYDFALEKICSHEVVFDRVSVATDLPDTIRFPRTPINQFVRLYLDGYDIPQTGLFSFAEIPFSRPEPYRLVSGQSDMLYVSIPGSAPRLITLPTGSMVRASDLAGELARKLPELNVGVKDGRVVFRAYVSGTHASFSFPDPLWTDRTNSLPTTTRILGAYKALGIVPGRVVSGTQIFPAWHLIPDESSPVEGAKLIQFATPLKNSSPIVYVSYFTSAAECRRCQGSGIEFDYNVVNGTYERISGADLLAQEFDKFLFTRSGSHFKWPWMGSQLGDRIGSKNLTTGFSTSSMITMDVTQAFRIYQNLKIQQDQRYPFQKVSDDEMPMNLGDISVQQIPNDPTTAIVRLFINTRSREPVELKRLVGNPSPFLLPGDNVPFRYRS